MEPEETLEGWAPQVGDAVPLARVIDLAFDYRGNTIVVRTDGSEMHGYVFNRNADPPEPFIQMFDVDGGGPHTVLYRDIRTIRFTGRDMAAGQSYAAWRERKSLERPAPERSGDDAQWRVPP